MAICVILFVSHTKKMANLTYKIVREKIPVSWRMRQGSSNHYLKIIQILPGCLIFHLKKKHIRGREHCANLPKSKCQKWGNNFQSWNYPNFGLWSPCQCPWTWIVLRHSFTIAIGQRFTIQFDLKTSAQLRSIFSWLISLLL